MPSTASSLLSLIQSIDASSRDDSRRRQNLLSQCEAILNSHIGRDRDADIASIAGAVKRQLLQQPGGSNLSLRFSNLVSRLTEQPVLSRKPSVLLFLQSLASPPTQNGSSPVPPFLPSLAIPEINLSLRSPSPLGGRSATPTPSQNQRQVAIRSQTKAELLREWRAKTGKKHLAERFLLRDTLYLLQGISGRYVKFAGHDAHGQDYSIVFEEDPEYIIPSSTRALIHKISEIGHLYWRVSSFVKERQGSTAAGMIEQSLCHHLQTQLTEYYRLVALLESQMNQGNTDGGDRPSDEPNLFSGEMGLTLRRLDVWIDDWRLRMRMMSVCVENCKDARGGALVSLIHAHTNNGDPFVQAFTNQLLEDVCKPVFDTLQKWLFTGDLHDPYSEFFVQVNPKLANVRHVPSSSSAYIANLSVDVGFDGGPATSTVALDEDGEVVSGQQLWENKFIFKKDMIPSFIGEEFARKIFSTGKSLNFIRYNCHDVDWVETQSQLSPSTLKYSDIEGLEQSIDAAYKVASQRLFEIFFQKFQLIKHMEAMKGYIMLGQGDFAEQLMESLGPTLFRPAHQLYLHHLTAALETSIRSSTAARDSANILRRLDARMLEHSDQDTGWDAFSLVYKVDAPIDTVLDPMAMIQYQRLFNHLWKMKRVESVSSTAWSKVARARKTFAETLPDYTHKWHEIAVILEEMIHFVRALGGYSQLEVIAVRWKALMEFTSKKEGDLDQLIELHQNYLRQVVAKVLLLHPKKEKETDLLNRVREAFALILDFCASTDNFYDHCLRESSRRDTLKDHDRGTATIPPGQEPRQDSEEMVEAMLTQIHHASTEFSSLAAKVVTGLHVHPDQDCRSLAVRLTFNEYYKVTKPVAKSSTPAPGASGSTT